MLTHILSGGVMADQEKTAAFFNRTKRIGGRKEDKREVHWHKYQEEKDPVALEDLFAAYEPEMNRRIGSFQGAMVPTSAMKNFAKRKALKAFQTWNPEQEGGASLATWVSHKVRNIGEDIDRYKSETQIRGKRNRLVGKIIDATDSLSEEYGREPTVEELAAEIGAPEREITKTLAEWKADIDPISTEPNPFHGDVLTSHQQQMIRLVRHDLRQNERLIWDMYWGMNGQAKLTKQSQIARKAGVSDGTVTRTLQKITKKLQDEGIF